VISERTIQDSAIKCSFVRIAQHVDPDNEAGVRAQMRLDGME
jgi:hypothetical protein